jgi:hypothetical protein
VRKKEGIRSLCQTVGGFFNAIAAAAEEEEMLARFESCSQKQKKKEPRSSFAMYMFFKKKNLEQHATSSLLIVVCHVTCVPLFFKPDRFIRRRYDPPTIVVAIRVRETTTPLEADCLRMVASRALERLRLDWVR